MKAVFWLALLGIALPAYAYVGYPILLFVLAALVQTGRDVCYLLSRAERRRRSNRRPRVSIILAAYNEEHVLDHTLRNVLALDYPRDLVEIIIGSDGSTDGTVEIARRYEPEGVRVSAFRERRGKIAVINACAAQAKGDILVFSDANTLLRPDAVSKLVRHFDAPTVGAVCGELHLVTADGRLSNESLYWRYEMGLKMLESRLDSVLGANGAIYAVRKELFPSLPGNLITDDFIIPMKVRAKHFRVAYDPEAVAEEDAPVGVADEFRRRMRIGAGNWQALWHCRRLLLPWMGFVSFAFWSHKVLRWLTPFLLPVGLFGSLLLLAEPVWQVLFGLQVVFYGAAALGCALGRLRVPVGPLKMPYYFLALNSALAIGLLRGALGVQRAAWKRTARKTIQTGAIK